MTAWHMDEDMVQRYTAGTLAATPTASVEAHLLACARCRDLIEVPRERLDRLWDGIADAVDVPVPGPFERLLRLLGVREHTARLLGAASSLRLSWLAAGALALLFTLLAARETSRWGVLFFLTVAPVLPVAGVGMAFGRGADPAYEIGLAAPYSAFRIMLMRALAVLAATAVPATVLGLPLLGQTWALAAWLLPAIALTVLALALASWFEPLYSAAAVSSVWVLVVVGGNVREPSPAMFGAGGQLVFLILTIVSGALLVARRKEFS